MTGGGTLKVRRYHYSTDNQAPFRRSNSKPTPGIYEQACPEEVQQVEPGWTHVALCYCERVVLHELRFVRGQRNEFGSTIVRFLA